MKTVAVTEVDTVSQGRRVFSFFSKLEKKYRQQDISLL